MDVQLLTAAYRSRPRPSSTPGAKASTVCPYYLDGDQTGHAQTRPALVIPVFKLANICGFQGPVRSAAAGDSGGRSLKTQQRAARPSLSREERTRASKPGRHARRPAGIEAPRPAPYLKGAPSKRGDPTDPSRQT